MTAFANEAQMNPARCTFSQRACWDLAPNELVCARQRRLSSGQDLLDLTVSNPTTVGLHYERALLDGLSGPQALLYEPAALGLPSVRQAVAAEYDRIGLKVSPERIVLTASSSESYSFLLKLLCDAGDSILVPRPSYPLFDDLAKLESVQIATYPLRVADDWRIDVEALRQAVHERVRAVFIVSPNNPTGSYLHADERDAIEELAAEAGLAIVCDEVFADYVWRDEPQRVRCAAHDAKVLTFTLDGLSKAACLPQVKLGWMVVGGPEQACREALGRLEAIADTYLSVSTPVQHGVQQMLAAAPGLRAQMSERVRTNLAAVKQMLPPGGLVQALDVAAGWYVLLRVPSVVGDETWAVWLTERDGVFVHPGEFFGFESPGYLVLSLITEPHVFREGLKRLVRRVESQCAQPACTELT